MSRSHKHSKAPGTHLWKPRPPKMGTPGRISKQIAKAKERAAERELERRALADDDLAASDGPKRSPCKPRG